MYLVELQFECFDNTTLTAVDKAINGLIEALRYNGQILGREFPIIMGDAEFLFVLYAQKKIACILNITRTM